MHSAYNVYAHTQIIELVNELLVWLTLYWTIGGWMPEYGGN